MPESLNLRETDARAVLLLQAAESVPDSPLWTAEDRAWATRLARETLPDRADDTRSVSERARHAMKRLLPRAPGLAALASRHSWHAAWPVLALGLGGLFGVFVDQLGGTQRINLLAPPLWGVVMWNLAVLVALAANALRRRGAARPGALRTGLERWIEPTLSLQSLSDAERPISSAFAVAWADAARGLRSLCAASLLHLAAAGLAVGMVGGLYLRGLLLDYRAGWQSTFLAAPQAQAMLDTALAPASRLTGIGVPAVAPLRVTAEQPPQGEAADWLHLYAATLLIFVIAPRGLLAAWSLRRTAALARRLPLPLDATLTGWLHALRGAAVTLRVVPHLQAPGPAAMLALREALARRWGDELVLDWSPRVAAGDEEQPRLPAGALPPWVVWADLGATPEVEAQGRLIAALRARGATVTLALDETAFVQRFVTMPERVAQRRQAWQDFAVAQGVELQLVAAQRNSQR